VNYPLYGVLVSDPFQILHRTENSLSPLEERRTYPQLLYPLSVILTSLAQFCAVDIKATYFILMFVL